MGLIFGYLVLGLLAGVLSGLVGLGGGFVIVPALVLLFGFTQHRAQGTSLALLLPPTGLLAAWAYYDRGFVDVKAAAIICLGVFAGSYFGAKIATSIPSATLEKVFGVILLLISLKMIFSSK